MEWQEQRHAESALVFDLHLDGLHGHAAAGETDIHGHGRGHQHFLARHLLDALVNHGQDLLGIGLATLRTRHGADHDDLAFGIEHGGACGRK